MLAGLVPAVRDRDLQRGRRRAPRTDIPAGLQAARARRFRSLPIPYRSVHALCGLWEWYARRSKGQLPPVFNRRMCAFAWKGHRYSNRKLKERLELVVPNPDGRGVGSVLFSTRGAADTMTTRVAIVGCGSIADQHADQLRNLAGCELVAACDTDELIARQLADRFHYPRLHRRKHHARRWWHRRGPYHHACPASLPAGQRASRPAATSTWRSPSRWTPVKPPRWSTSRATWAGASPWATTSSSPPRRCACANWAQRLLGRPPVHIETIQVFQPRRRGGYGKPVLGDRNPDWVPKLPRVSTAESRPATGYQKSPSSLWAIRRSLSR